MNRADWLITDRIRPEDEFSGFECTEAAATDFFIRRALAVDRAGIARVFVLRAAADDPPTVPTVLGYYTLSTTAVGPANGDRRRPASLADFPTPALLLARFAVHRRATGAGLGTLLLADALTRAVQVHEDAGVVAVLGQVPDEHALSFCTQRGFSPLASQGFPRKVILPMSSVLATIKQAWPEGS